MKHFIRITQTDDVETPEMHQDETDVKDKSNLSLEVFDIKNSLIGKMSAENYKIQRHICDHDEPIKKGCKLEDI
jgi:hypothetical protein